MDGRVAQLVEHSTLNRLVVGSIPTASTNNFSIMNRLQGASLALSMEQVGRWLF